MRRFLLSLTALSLMVLVIGCGSGNFDKAQKVNQQMVTEMMSVADAIEKGDKQAVKDAMARYRKLKTDNASLKVTVKEKKKIDEKLNAEIEKLKKRFEQVFTSAATSGKYTPQEIQQLASDIAALDR